LYYFISTTQHHRCLFIVAIVISSFFKQALGTGLEIDRNLHLGSWSPFASYWEDGSFVCAWTRSEDVGFRITALNHNNSNALQLTNDIGDGVSVTLSWEPTDNPYSGEQLKAGTPSSQTYFYNPSYGCGVNPNYIMRLRVDKADLDNAMPGIYRGTFVLILTPI
jgi:hypothetical protein